MTLLVYSLLIMAASLVGGWVPTLIKLTHRGMELAVSLVAGFILGIGLLHLLPHASAEIGAIEPTAGWVLLGFLAMFFIERFFCFHHHDVPDELAANAHDHDRCSHVRHGHDLTWSGAAMGLTLHSVIAGIALAASIQNEQAHVQPGAVPGLAVFLVIVLHKPFDSMSLSMLMQAGGWPLRARQVLNALFAGAVPAGAVLFVVGSGTVTHHPEGLVGPALAFSSGTFLCIAMSDLLPELQFHQHDRLKLSVALLLGLAMAWATSRFEAASHGHHDHADRHPPRELTPPVSGDHRLDEAHPDPSDHGHDDHHHVGHDHEH